MGVQHNDDYYYNIVRRNIKKYRKMRNYTQQQLAEETDLTADFIWEIESPKRNKGFSLSTLGRIADALDIPIEMFFDVTNDTYENK
ncbi:MAG: helix-turn-helix transcriptional regulator [bacterium]|nr:helix-turn-helix transcriptional regulator [bacterium]